MSPKAGRDKQVQTFPKCFSPKLNIIAQPEIEIPYDDVPVQKRDFPTVSLSIHILLFAGDVVTLFLRVNI